MIICDTALIIKRVFDSARIFRIGGDEFIAIMEGRYTDKYMLELFKQLDKELASFNANEKKYDYGNIYILQNGNIHILLFFHLDLLL